jgi:hypothetical protein
LRLSRKGLAEHRPLTHQRHEPPMKPLSIALLLLMLPAIATAATPEQNYLTARDGFIAKLKKMNSSGAGYVKAEDAAKHNLEAQLERIIGPFDMAGVKGLGKINLDTLSQGDEGFGMLDGLAFAAEDKSVDVIVTTDGLFDAWLKGHRDWWKGMANVPPVGADALRFDAFYTQAISTDAAVSKFAELPVAKPAAASFATAMLAMRSQDEGVGAPDEIFVAVMSGGRVLIAYAAVGAKVAPIAACDAIWKAAEAKATAAFAAEAAAAPKDQAKMPDGGALREQGAAAFRACFAERFKATPDFAKVSQQAQALLDRLPAAR